MEKYVFLYKTNKDDRDCVAYIDNSPMRFECGHYFGGVNLYGACYSNNTFENYENIKTILTKNEYEQLIKFNEEIKALGYGITKDDERYNKGIELCKNIQSVYDKLLSHENMELFKEVQEEEKEYLMYEYDLSEEDVEEIFNNYTLPYRDRGIVSCVFENAYELGYEEAFSCGYVSYGNDIQERYFDFELFGNDLLDENERYMQLYDDRCVVLNY